MTANKKQRDSKKENKVVKKSIKTSKPKREIQKFTTVSQPRWEKVKIAGNLVTDDGGGMEGLIGLEVMEDYSRKHVTREKVGTLKH